MFKFHKKLVTFKNPTKIRLDRTCCLNTLSRNKQYMERKRTKKYLSVCPNHSLRKFVLLHRTERHQTYVGIMTTKE